MLLLGAGITINDYHDITYGMAINLLWERNRAVKRENGEEIADPEKQYRVMKANLPALEELYKAGRVRKEKYEAYISALERWESER